MNTADAQNHPSNTKLAPVNNALIDDTLNQVDELLNQFAHFGVELGLERIQRLLADLGNPQNQVPIVHVAGSNGKGSTCAYLSSVLTEAGYRVGRYISPHLVSWCERICLNQQEISATELHHLLLQVVAVIRPDQPSPTQFEVITAAAWLYFAQQQVDIAVMEVGLGGRLDATNVCDRPLVSIITSLSLEHQQKLGPTLTHIAREKAGILKPNCPAVIAPQPAEATAVLQQRVNELNCPTWWVTPAVDVGDGWAEYRNVGNLGHKNPEHKNLEHKNLEHGNAEEGEIRSFKYPLPLPGVHQLTNSALAIATLQILQDQGWAITEQQMVQGMAKTEWKGRLQWFTWRGQPILIDGAHNPAGAEMLRHYVENSDRVTQPISWVMGMIGTKDHSDVFKALLRPGDSLFLVPVPDHLSADLDALATLAKAICPQLNACTVHEDCMRGLEAAVRDRGASNATIVLCGSLYLIGDFLKQTAHEHTL